MFKKIKKFYFKIYHLFKLLSIFIFFFVFSYNVYAEVYTTVPYQSAFIVSEESCTDNLFNPVFVTDAYVQGGSTKYVNNTASKTSYRIPVKPSTTYSITPMSNLVYSYWITFSSTATGKNFGSGNPNGMVTTFTTTSNTYYLLLTLTSQDWTLNPPFEIMLNEGSTLLPYVPFKTTCPPPPSDNENFSDFISIFTDRFSYLVTGFTSNSYLICFVGIIFSFVILELFIKLLHIKGGRR